MTARPLDELVTRYFPYLAADLRAVGLSDLAERLYSTGGLFVESLPQDLEQLLAAGMNAGVGLAYTVELQRQVVELVRQQDTLDPSAESVSLIEQLIRLQSDLRFERNSHDPQTESIAQARFDDAAATLHRQVDSLALGRLLAFAGACEDEGLAI